MKKRRVWTVSPIFYIMAIAMLAMSLVSYRSSRVVFGIEFTVSLLAIVCVVVSDILFRKNTSVALKSAKRLLSADEDQGLLSFALPVAVVAPAGDVIWGNGAFISSFCPNGENHLGESVLKYIYPKTLKQVMGENGSAVMHGGHEYTVYTAKVKRGVVLYFVDDTYFKTIYRNYREKRPVIGVASFDNREELSRDSESGEDSRITADVESVIRKWAIDDLGGFVRKLSNNRYLFVTDEQHTEEAKSKRFEVLDRIRAIKSSGRMNATVSIGIGRNSSDIAESERWARQALDMALGRGGDQVAVMQGSDNYEFFGGLSKGVEKRDKVRTRVIASALSDNIVECDKVFIMGHRNSDLDAIGAAEGLWAVISKGLEIPTFVVVNRESSMAQTLINSVEAAYPETRVFVHPLEALQMYTERSMLIVVDTHSVSMVESQDLLSGIGKVVVIDHHRMVVSHIKNAMMFYHEPYASSTCEMVTELAQYIKSSAIESVDAQALLSGIMLDTKSFVLKTGVRTFEAAAFLRRRGADTVEVRRMFASSLDTYKQKAQIVSSAEIYKECAIATSDWEGNDIRLAAAQAADELLSIDGVKASFVLFRMGEDVNISGRSLGNINVQLILEEFGGGGHFNMAGAQIKQIAVSDARRALIKALDSKLESARQ